MSTVNSQKFNLTVLPEVAGTINAAANHPADKLTNILEIIANQKGSIITVYKRYQKIVFIAKKTAEGTIRQGM